MHRARSRRRRGRAPAGIRVIGRHTFRSISVGFGAVCGIDTGEAVWCWGRNDVGQLGNGSTASAGAVNSTPSVVTGQRPLP
ncbi:MAG: hypothetical protein V4617_14710 [Gemmatimonadota bacterium]